MFIFHLPEGPVDVFSLGLDLTVVTMMMRLMGIVMMIGLLIHSDDNDENEDEVVKPN